MSCFSFYKVNAAYCDFLRDADPCVPYTMDQKSARPFVGIVFSVNGFQYYAPLTSPKPKHLNMKNQVDFMKVNRGTWGAINFNNMIPVVPECVEKVDMRITSGDSKADRDYKNLLSNQLSWCNSHRTRILKQAEKLHAMIVQGKAWPTLVKRCCDFRMDEERCKEYVHQNLQHEVSASVRRSKVSVRETLAAASRACSDRHAHLQGTKKDKQSR
ncbi:MULTISPECIES: type III toxin-antitoxin system ToxN/AbiQ family toxin [Pseudoflavonifractor]|uniref:type III toxin-antitoxin system ToxN/AbiQ family toxin n=1 Tax=Pseudoflavonifractor TaxID=1017280 RepID=UPI000B5854A7|nr:MULTISPECIES: type III toxin-antitoxin system ToxN/AbiQ family toxin [Pseudoflavonifractor]OUP62794.1 hypothetical protein B5F12_09515 [Pseudoflavonifractor sp. An176]